MSRYIDADKARDNSTDPYVRIYLDSQPTADVAPVVHAHRENAISMCGQTYKRCSLYAYLLSKRDIALIAAREWTRRRNNENDSLHCHLRPVCSRPVGDDRGTNHYRGYAMMETKDFIYLQNATVVRAILKARDIIPRHYNIVVSISGGSDSDIVLDMVERNKREGQEIHYVFFDTGIEYKATKDHLDYLEQKYGIKIERIKAEKPIPLCVKEYGVPFLSKYVSQMVCRLQKAGFKWEDDSFEVLNERYPNCVSTLQWWCNDAKGLDDGHYIKQYRIDYYPYLKEFLMENPPPFKIADKCCLYAKKKVAKQIQKKYTADLDVVGVRKAEGGIRATQYKTCFSQEVGTDHFRPVFWLTDEDKRFYEQEFGIVHSDCYKKYGMKRTGCVGCPFGRNVTEELKVIETFEPRLYKAALNVFGQSYEYTQRYKQFRQRKKEEAKRDANQITIDFGGGE